MRRRQGLVARKVPTRSRMGHGQEWTEEGMSPVFRAIKILTHFSVLQSSFLQRVKIWIPILKQVESDAMQDPSLTSQELDIPKPI